MKTAVYLRVSTDSQSHDSQRLALEQFCNARGWSDLTFYFDQISGYKASREGLDALLGDVRAGKVTRLLVYKLDRLGRSLTHLALLLDELHRHGVALIVTSQGIDTSQDNPVGRLQLNVLMAVAEFERGLIRDRVLAGLKAAKAKGQRLGRPKLSQSQIDQVLACRGSGWSLRMIADRTQVSLSSVQRLCRPQQTVGKNT